VFEPADVTFAEGAELTGIRNGRRLKVKHSSTGMASCWLSLRQEYPIIAKKAIEAFLHIFSAVHTMKSRNTRGGLVGMLVNHPTADKGHHETSRSTGFPLIFLCLNIYFLFIFMFITNFMELSPS
jgi:hypothetical protein